MKWKMINCQTCGFEESIFDLVVYCAQCEEIMVHRYCMDGPLTYGVERVVWFCDECSPRFVKNLENNQQLKDGNRDSLFQINLHLKDENKDSLFQVDTIEADPGLKSERSLVLPLKPNHDKEDHVFDLEPKFSKCSKPNDHVEVKEPKYSPLITSDGHAKLSFRREDIVKVSKSLANEDNMPNSTLGDRNDTCMHDHDVDSLDDNRELPLPSLKRFPSKPKDDITWRGICQTSHEMHYKVSFELKAHLSVSASCNVSNAMQTLPTTLDLEMVPKSENWPKRFIELNPSGEDIGLYFFPMHESDEKPCAGLLEKMIEDDLILKFTRSDLKLLMFTSFDLPKEIFSYKGKCYLWGVFSSPTSSSTSNETSVMEKHPSKKISESVCITKVAKRSCEKKVKRHVIQINDAPPISSHARIKKRGHARRTTEMFVSSPIGILKNKHVGNDRHFESEPLCIVNALSTTGTSAKTKHKHGSSQLNRSKKCFDAECSPLKMVKDKPLCKQQKFIHKKVRFAV